MSKRVDLLRLVVIGDMYGVINVCGDLLCYCETIKDCKERLKIKYDFTDAEMDFDEPDEENLVLVSDFTETLYDRERDNYLTADILRELFFEDKNAVERFNGDFSAYFDECTGKNGTLEIIERNWGDLRV